MSSQIDVILFLKKNKKIDVILNPKNKKGKKAQSSRL